MKTLETPSFNAPETPSFNELLKKILRGVGLLCFVAFASATARADEVSLRGTTSGSFTSLGGTTTARR